MNKTLLENICITLGTQGGSLSQYDNDYILANSAFGNWHKHCKKGKVLSIGIGIMDYFNYINDYKKIKEVEIGFEVNEKDYLIMQDKRIKSGVGLYIYPKKVIKMFNKELILNDRY